MSLSVQDDRAWWRRLHYTRSLWTGPAFPCERCHVERVAVYYSVGRGVQHILCAPCLDELEAFAAAGDLLPKVPS